MQNDLLSVIKNLRIDAYSQTKTCFINDCPLSTIKSHSLAQSKILRNIAEKGEVMYYEINDKPLNLNLQTTGKKKASTFPGFCKHHDQVIFTRIDNEDYIQGDQCQEFLFAMRGCAREFTVRNASDKLLNMMRDPDVKSRYGLPDNIPEDEFQQMYNSFRNGTRNVSEMRSVFNASLEKQRYWRIETISLELDKAYPIAASSVFKLEIDNKGNIVNDLLNVKAKGHPLFYTLFPQKDKTYCLLSWFNKDRHLYRYLPELLYENQQSLKIIISNLLCSYVENFVVNPVYWESLPLDMRDAYEEQWGFSTIGPRRTKFVENANLNIFS